MISSSTESGLGVLGLIAHGIVHGRDTDGDSEGVSFTSPLDAIVKPLVGLFLQLDKSALADPNFDGETVINGGLGLKVRSILLRRTTVQNSNVCVCVFLLAGE